MEPQPESVSLFTRRAMAILEHLEGDCQQFQLVSTEVCSKTEIVAFDSEELRRLRLGPFFKYIDAAVAMRKRLLQEDFFIDPEWSYHQLRDEINKQAKRIASMGVLKAEMLRDDPLLFLASIMGLAVFNLNLIAKIVIHYQLLGGTILELGTEYHHKKYLSDINNMTWLGGFALTEMGHGSNARNIETTATYDPKTKEFVLNTPTPAATKFWIGNLAVYGNLCVTFAQLIHNGQNKGLHGFVVQLRSRVDHKVLPGIELGDCGLKTGWNGIDNAWIRFHQHRIPRENLLNRFADVTPDGDYVCMFPKQSLLFSATISQLMVGRLLYVLGPILGLNITLLIAVRYATQRRQFGAPGQPETRIIDYQSHQRRLGPMVAASIVFDFIAGDLSAKIGAAMADLKQREEYHGIISGVKAYVCDVCNRHISQLRIMCGGFGVSYYNRIGEFKNELDIFQTAEGDEVVLYQQTARFLLNGFNKQYGGGLAGLWKYLSVEFGIDLMLETGLVGYRQHSRQHLTGPSFFLNALKFRVSRRLYDVAKKMQALRSQKMKPLEIWNACLHKLIKVARHFVEFLMVDNAVKVVKQAKNAETKKLLKLVVSTFALYCIDEDADFFRNKEYIAAAKAEEIEELLTVLCGELVAIAPQIVDSLDVPDELLRAPIAVKDGDYVKHMLEAAISRGRKFK